MKPLPQPTRTGVLLSAGLLGFALLCEPAFADLVTTDQVIAREQAQTERERVKALMGRADVAKQLQALGVPPEEAQARADAMTSEEIRSVDGKLAALPAGGALGTTEWLLIILLIVLIAIVIWPDRESGAAASIVTDVPTRPAPVRPRRRVCVA